MNILNDVVRDITKYSFGEFKEKFQKVGDEFLSEKRKCKSFIGFGCGYKHYRYVVTIKDGDYQKATSQNLINLCENTIITIFRRGLDPMNFPLSKTNREHVNTVNLIAFAVRVKHLTKKEE